MAPKMMTLDELRKRDAASDPEDDQEFYAGGEKSYSTGCLTGPDGLPSGMAVQGGAARPIVDDIMSQARRYLPPAALWPA